MGDGGQGNAFRNLSLMSTAAAVLKMLAKSMPANISIKSCGHFQHGCCFVTTSMQAASGPPCGFLICGQMYNYETQKVRQLRLLLNNEQLSVADGVLARVLISTVKNITI